MKNKLTYVIAAFIVGIVATVNVITVLRLNSMYNSTLMSIDALSEYNWGGENDGEGENNWTGDIGWIEGDIPPIWSQPKRVPCDLQQGGSHTASIERVCKICCVPYSCTPVKCGDVF